jgi:hypothetical protein
MRQTVTAGRMRSQQTASATGATLSMLIDHRFVLTMPTLAWHEFRSVTIESMGQLGEDVKLSRTAKWIRRLMVGFPSLRDNRYMYVSYV